MLPKTEAHKNLKRQLDKIWHANNRSELAPRILEELTDSEWCLVGAWALSTLMPIDIKQISILDGNRFAFLNGDGNEILAGRVGKSGPNQGESISVEFSEYGYSAFISNTSSIVPQAGEVDDPVKIILLLQYIRDHIDSVLFLPADMRHDRFNSISNDYSISIDRLKRMIINIRAISEYI